MKDKKIKENGCNSKITANKGISSDSLKKCGCGGTIENIESIKGEPEEHNGCGCVSESDDSSVKDVSGEDDGCSCGLDKEYPDKSMIKNPDKPKFLAEADFIKELENYVQSLGIKAVGYAQITPDLLIKDRFIQYPNVIVLTMEMAKEIIEATPGPEAQKLNDAAYEKLGNISYKISDYLRGNGYSTEVAHPYDSIVKFSKLGQKAGLGWIGQSGLLITPELGPRQKISAIFVSIANLPIEEENKHSWLVEYCKKCGKCIKACPEKALIEKDVCCGEKETEFIQKLCIGCSKGCTYCIEECPFELREYKNIKDRFDRMNAKLRSKQ